MPAELSPQVQPQAAAALVSYLREHPDLVKRPATELAEQFGLDVSFVRSVQDGLEPPQAEERRDIDWKKSFGFVGRTWRRTLNLFDRATMRPGWFVAITTVVALASSALLGLYAPPLPIVSGDSLRLDQLIMLFIGFGTLGAHMACYFYRRMARHALFGGLIVWVGCGTMMMAIVWAQGPGGQGEEGRFVEVFGVGIAMFVLSLMYAGFGSIMAVLGAWTRFKIQEQEQERMSRQELLERYFELQTRLQQGAHAQDVPAHWQAFPPVVWFKEHPYLGSFAGGVAIGLLTVLILGPLGFDPRLSSQNSLHPLLAAISLLTGTANFLFYIVTGFVASRVPKALGQAALINLGSILPMMLPIGNYGPDRFGSAYELIRLAIVFVFMAGVSAIAALGGIVQHRTRREQRLGQNDQASLVAEMLRIQWRLADHVSNVCVMVVDAAKSSVMKSEADPLAVEYSFREYQEWLEAIGGGFGGRVHSTAGDGAVIAFTSCDGALDAAKRIQTDLSRFNRDVNRLRSPFRLRIGLHVGPVAGDIGEVQFTEVIDIAAHVQELSPISGVAVTDSVASMVPGEQLLPLSVEADGHKVLLVMNPIEV